MDSKSSFFVAISYLNITLDIYIYILFIFNLKITIILSSAEYLLTNL